MGFKRLDAESAEQTHLLASPTSWEIRQLRLTFCAFLSSELNTRKAEEAAEFIKS